jgi:hypothetical protein
MSNVRPHFVAAVLRRSVLFAAIAFAVLFTLQVSVNLFVYKYTPPPETRVALFSLHAQLLGGTLLVSAVGAALGFAVLRARLPSMRVTMAVALAFAFATVLAGPGSFILAGLPGTATWFLLGAAAFALGSGVFRKPWLPPPL